MDGSYIRRTRVFSSIVITLGLLLIIWVILSMLNELGIFTLLSNVSNLESSTGLGLQVQRFSWLIEAAAGIWLIYLGMKKISQINKLKENKKE